MLVPCSLSRSGYPINYNVPIPEFQVLKAIDRAEIPLLPMIEPDAVQEGSAAVPVPDLHILLLQLLGRGQASDEPEQFLSPNSSTISAAGQ